MEKRTEAQSRALQDVQNEFVESRREQNRFQEKFIRKEKALRDTQIGSELSSPRVSSDKSSELSAHQTRIRGSCGVFLRAELIKSFSEACEDFYSELSAHQIPVRSLRRVFLRAEPPSNAYPRLVGVLLRAEFSSNPSERGTQQPPRLVLGSCAFSLSLGLTTPASWADSHCELRSRRGVLPPVTIPYWCRSPCRCQARRGFSGWYEGIAPRSSVPSRSPSTSTLLQVRCLLGPGCGCRRELWTIARTPSSFSARGTFCFIYATT